MKVTFHGVRGSYPSLCPATARYGGNTSCVSITVEGEPPILLDLGSGLARYAAGLCPEAPFEGNALVTHLHLDHVQGLPFFRPANRDGSRLTVHAPAAGDRSLEDEFHRWLRPPFFPLAFDALVGDVSFRPVGTGSRFHLGGAEVTARPVPHVGPTVGYRIDWDGVSLAYVSDHQQPAAAGDVAGSVLALCDGVDLLIHEAQYMPSELGRARDWGHCTVDYAVHVAHRAGVRRLCLFHHDPGRSDDDLDLLLGRAAALGAQRGLQEVTAAAEGQTVVV